MKTDELTISDQEIAQRAYEIWESRGCPQGDGNQDWSAAQSQLIAERIRRNGSTQQRVRSIWDRLRQKIAR